MKVKWLILIFLGIVFAGASYYAYAGPNFGPSNVNEGPWSVVNCPNFNNDCYTYYPSGIGLNGSNYQAFYGWFQTAVPNKQTGLSHNLMYEACIGQNGPWGGDTRCQIFISCSSSGACDGVGTTSNSIYVPLSDVNDYNFLKIHIYANNYTVQLFPQQVSWRRVWIQSFDVSNFSPNIGESFTVSWGPPNSGADVQNPAPGNSAVFHYSGSVTCDWPDGFSFNPIDPLSGGFTSVNCTGIAPGGPARVWMDVFGPGGNGGETVTESRDINVFATAPGSFSLSVPAQCTGGGNFHLQWTDAQGVDYYEVWARPGVAGSWSLLGTIGGLGNSWDTTQAVNTDWYFKVIAINSQGSRESSPGGPNYTYGGNCFNAAAVCGNGILEGSEVCDNGASNGACPAACSTSCTTNAACAKTLTVIKNGTGAGSVNSSPAGINNCTGTCSSSFNTGSAVTLTETPSTGSFFGGWIGCDSVSGNTCTISAMNSDRTVYAEFDPSGAGSKPTVDLITIDSPMVKTDGSKYNITMVSSDPDGRAIYNQYAIINYDNITPNGGIYRGYLTWYPADIFTGNPAYKDVKACGGTQTGYAAVYIAGFGDAYLDLDSCSVSMSGNKTTSTFNVNFNPIFSANGPFLQNGIAGFVTNSAGTNSIGWYGFNNLFDVATIPVVNNITISSPTVKTNGTQYNIVMTSSDNGGRAIYNQYTVINYDNTSPNGGIYRGYIVWYPANIWAGYKDDRLCGGTQAGYAAIYPGFGDSYIDLDSCSVSMSGNTTTTTYIVHFAPNFSTDGPFLQNGISGFVTNSIGMSSIGWYGFNNLFNVTTVPTINDVSISSSSVLADNTTNYNIVAGGSDQSGASNITRVQTQINLQGSNAGAYRGSLAWSLNDDWPGGKDRRSCGGGIAEILDAGAGFPGLGDQYIRLDSCAVTDVGNTRTVTFVVRFTTLFSSPTTNNDISGAITNSYLNTNPGGWSDTFPNNKFSLVTIPVTSLVGFTEPNYCQSGPGGSVGWTYSDPSASPQNGYRVQISSNSGFTSIVVDTCPLNTGCFGGNSTLYTIPQATLVFNQTYWARVKVWNSGGGESGWTNMSLCTNTNTPGGCQAGNTSWKTPLHAWPDIQQITSHDPLFSPGAPAVNSNVTFTDRTSFSGAGPNSWLWSFGDAQTSNVQNPIHQYTVSGIYQMTLKSTDGDGYACTSSPKSISVGRTIPIWKEVAP